MQALEKKKKNKKKFTIKKKGENPNDEKIYAWRNLMSPKKPNEPMAIDPNSKVNQGATTGDGNDAKGKSKSKVDPAIFRMAEERDY